MKQVKILGKRQAELIDVPDPKAVANWAVVKIHATPMCNEYHAFEEGNCCTGFGHEASGEIVEVAQPCRVKVGDRVVVQPVYPCGKCRLCVQGDFIHCQNSYDFTSFTGSETGSATYAQYIVKPDWLLSPIPDDVSYEHASLACCALGPSFGAFNTMKLDSFDTVLITGLGPVGMGAIVNAAYRGARIIAIDTIPWRMEYAKALGAEVVLDGGSENVVGQIREVTDGHGADKAIDCSGSPKAHRVCIEGTGVKGIIGFVGQCGDATPVYISGDLIGPGRTLFGAWHYNLNLFPSIMQVIQQSPVIDRLVTHIFPMSQVQKAFEVSASHECAKIILKPWE
jgi:L-iditol 2-dehydrogenase